MIDKGMVFSKLLHIADKNNIKILFTHMPGYGGRIRGKRIALNIDECKNIDYANSILAHELAHAYLHYDKGDTMNSSMYAEYEEQADRAAKFVLDFIEG